MTSPDTPERRRPDTPPAGMGGSFRQYLRYQQKQERLAEREEQHEQKLREAKYQTRAQKAARTRRKRKRAQERAATLRGVIFAGIAALLLIAGAAIKHLRSGTP